MFRRKREVALRYDRLYNENQKEEFAYEKIC